MGAQYRNENDAGFDNAGFSSRMARLRTDSSGTALLESASDDVRHHLVSETLSIAPVVTYVVPALYDYYVLGGTELYSAIKRTP